MAIEWGITGQHSYMGHKVLDNSADPKDVLQAGAPFQIEVKWDVPASLASLIGPGDQFRLRAYAESIGPGQEVQVGPTTLATGVPNQTSYTQMIDVNPNPLLGEGQAFGGVLVSGLYKIVCVLQHINGGVVTIHSGASDQEPMVVFKAP